MFSLLPWRRKEAKVPVRTEAEERFWYPLARIREEFDRLLDRVFSRWPELAEEGLAWGGLDLSETDKEYVVRVDAPGFEPEEFDLQLSGNRLVIRAEKKAEQKKQAKGKAVEEVTYRCLHRTLTLPNAIDANRVEAKYHNGVLEIRIGKHPEASGRKVPVKSS